MTKFDVTGPSLPIVGYADRITTRSGDRLTFMVSAECSEYEAALVTVSHRTERRTELAAPFNGSYAGRSQRVLAGSYVRFEHDVALPESFVLEAWMRATAPAAGVQGIVTWGPAHGLFVGDEGRLELRLGSERLRTVLPARECQWIHVTAGADARAGTAFLRTKPLASWLRGESVERRLAERIRAAGEPLVMGACWQGDSVVHCFDGKIDGPSLTGVDQDVVGRWDFSLDIASRHVEDVGPNGFHGETVNQPTRGVTGWNWTGDESDYRRSPAEYGAISFHRDDLDDARWDSDFVFDVPADLESGLYAVRLRCEDGEDHVPFFVLPRAEGARKPIAFLAPTFSYLAYANERHWWDAPGLEELAGKTLDELLNPEDRWAYHAGLLSVYDRHSDGTGVCFSSQRRPIVNMRPYYSHPLLGAPHLLSADLHVLDWLEAKGFDFDVVTDDALDAQGDDAIDAYAVLVTGTHPEYCTRPMLAALERYVAKGGRIVYLGGNGFYWFVSVDPERPYVMEHRRGHAGTRPWQSDPGEAHHATTGELGGLCRYGGRSPHRLLGVGFSGFGFGEALPYTREPASFDDDVAWIFEGVDPAKPIGDFGLLFGGAAGFELDAIDYSLGTPPTTRLLASSSGFSGYHPALENVLTAGPPPVPRADMTYTEHPGGGAVFSVGSIAWGLSLGHDDDNDVSEITENVLRRFGGGGDAGTRRPAPEERSA